MKLDLKQILDQVTAYAHAKGHLLELWEANHSSSYTTVCMHCGAAAEVYLRHDGEIISHGAALRETCYVNTPAPAEIEFDQIVTGAKALPLISFWRETDFLRTRAPKHRAEMMISFEHSNINIILTFLLNLK